ncbi:MAG TPA: hypothetical protein VOB72_26785 [Candidatus Dormibacteraeota bacterium]|nr:hypothetical protein [Candidatus Dormibacteraeota bacterium]
MDQLIQNVCQRTGLSEDQVRPVAQAVIDDLKERMPQPGPGLLEQSLGGSGSGVTDAARDIFNR